MPAPGLADKLAALTPEQKQALFYEGLPSPYDFGALPCSRGLQGAYIAILTLRRRNSDLNQDNLDLLNTHMSDQNLLLAYLLEQVDQHAPPGELRDDLLERLNSDASPEERVSTLIAYMDALQPHLCRKTYSREEALEAIKAAIDQSIISESIKRTLIDSNSLEKRYEMFDNRIATSLHLIPGTPNPSRTFVDANSSLGLLGVYLSLRYGVLVVNLKVTDLHQDEVDSILSYLVTNGIVSTGDVRCIYGLEQVFDDSGSGRIYSQGDILYYSSFGNQDYDLNVRIKVLALMPVGSRLVLQIADGDEYPDEYFDEEKIVITPEEIPNPRNVPLDKIAPFDMTVFRKKDAIKGDPEQFMPSLGSIDGKWHKGSRGNC